MRIDLFGGTGFIGSRFNELYIGDVYVHPRNDNIPKYREILYMISTTHNYHVFDDVHKDVDTNLTKLLSVLENCKDRGVSFTYISSWFVYGDTTLPAKEDSPCNPKGFYSITKKCAEDLVISYCKTFNIPYRILRLSNVYGKNDSGVSKKKNALQYLVGEIKENKPIDLYYDGNFIRDYMHIDDVCRAIRICMDKLDYNQVINIGSGIPQNFREIIDFAISETKSLSIIRSVDATAFHKLVQVKDMYMDVSKLKSTGFVPEMTIYKGIKTILN